MTTRASVCILTLSATLSFGWVALAQQSPATNTPPPSGGPQVISCLQRAAQGSVPNGASAASNTQGKAGTAATMPPAAGTTTGAGAGNTANGTTGNASTGTTGTSTSGASTTGAGSMGSTTADTGGTGTGSTGMGTPATGAGGAAGTTGTGTGTAGTGTAGSGAGTTGSGTTGSATTGSGSSTTGSGTAGTTPTNGGSGKNLNSLSSAEVCFLDKAAASNQFEIQASQLALQKSTNSAVKKVAQMIISDHQTAGAKLKTLAASYGAVPSSQVNTQQQQLLQTLRGQSGKNFDLVYLTQQVASHNEAINLFTSYSQPASAPAADVRQFAAQTLPALKAHLQMVLSAQKSASSAGSTTTKPASGSK